ncbi:MAG: proline dehydrogenase family protein [Bacteroidetes bacterium]|nr:proline dehydrogenase family protein [Bacteroidota bacterium]MDA0904033.1 proline dehydrogenase family protein [Bacteroidota bacterium]MDA1242725.1 proline dehydrogenase family protein [Bacteroidota bacterium]
MSQSSLPRFNDTAQAFQHLSNAELRRAVALFSLIGKPWLVQVGSAMANLALALRIPLGWAVRPTVYAHFCGGESIDDSEETVAKLAAHNVRTILDYSAEGQTDEADLDATCSEVLATIHAADGDARHAFAVFKVSGLSSNALLEKVGKALAGRAALSQDDEAAWERVQRRVRTLCEATAAAGGRILIDAEESWIQDAIDALAEDMMSDYNREQVVVYTTAQMYRHDRLAYLRDMAERAEEGGYACGVKLVRGAYMEKERERAEKQGHPSPIQPDKASTDRDFDAAVAWVLDRLERVHLVAGSHNEASNLRLCELMAERGLDPGDARVAFAQLLGMSDPITFNLAAHGYNVAKYVPYGPIREAIPYLIRRAQENTSVAGQTSRELDLLKREQSRRNSA